MAEFCSLSSSPSQKVSSRPTLADEILLVATPGSDLDPKSLLAPLAALFHAEWVEDEAHQLHLALPDKVVRTQLQDAREERSALLERWLEQRNIRLADEIGEGAGLRVVLNQLRDWRARAASGSLIVKGQPTVVPRAPLDTLLDRLLVALGADALASTEPGSTVSYCNRPVGAQLPLPKAAEKAVADCVEAINQLWGAISPEDKPTGPFTGVWDPLFNSLRHIDRQVKVLLTRIPSYSRIAFRLRVYDADGTCLGTAYTEVDTPNTPSALGVEAETIGQLPERVELGTQNLAFQKLVEAGSRAIADPDAPAPGDPGVLLDRNFEPIGLGMTEAVTALAEASGRTVLANLPDSCLGPALAMCTRGVVNPRALWIRLIEDGIVGVEIQPTLILIRPKDPSACRKLRIERSALFAYARQVVENGGARLQSEAELCFQGGPGATVGDLQATWRRCLMPYGLASPYSPLRYCLGYLLGGLDGATWNSLLEGKPLALSQLDPVRREMFRDWLESSPPTDPVYSLEPSAAFPYAGLDCRIVILTQFDPKIRCTTPGNGDLGYYPRRQMRMSDFAEQLWSYALQPDTIGSALTGRYELVPSQSLSAVARLGSIEWSKDSLVNEPTGAILRDVPYSEWPNASRVQLNEYLKRPGGSPSR